jgi:hypothetical protein
MTDNTMTRLLAAVALTLGMLAVGCMVDPIDDGSDDPDEGDLTLTTHVPEAVDTEGPMILKSKIDDPPRDPGDSKPPELVEGNPYTFPVEDLLLDPATLEVVGYVDLDTLDYVFDNGDVIAADAILDVEAGVMIPDEYEHDGEEYQLGKPSDDHTREDQIHTTEPPTPPKEVPGPEGPITNVVAVYVDDHGDIPVLCSLSCGDEACVETCANE